MFTSLEGSPGGAAASPALELSLTTVYTVLYSVLFLFVYLQLWLILHYGHKRFSFQSVFLFLCLLWAALRTTLFSFYFRNVLQANQLQPLAYWLLYCCPVCLQFFTLCLLNLYFTQVRLCLCDLKVLTLHRCTRGVPLISHVTTHCFTSVQANVNDFRMWPFIFVFKEM